MTKVSKKQQQPKQKLPLRRNILRAPRSSWISFLSSVRSENRAEYASLSFGALCRKLSPVWNSMTKAEKQPFIDTYMCDKERYVRQLTNLSETDLKVLRAHKRLRRQKRIGRPKTSMSSYMLFVIDTRANVLSTYPNLSFQDIGQELGRRWRTLSDTEKAVYNTNAAIDRGRFETELAKWKSEQVTTTKKQRVVVQ